MRMFARVLVAGLAVAAFAGTAAADFQSFVIRDGATASPGINPLGGGLTEFVINQGGMKAELGSNDINGSTIGDILSLQITRHDDVTRFTAGSGPAVAPYFNIWVTDGLGNYAVVANEPSNGAFQSLFTVNGDGSRTYDLSFADLQDKVAKVYEQPNAGPGANWLTNTYGTNLTFGDLASLMIAPPDTTYIGLADNNVSAGAPDRLSDSFAYGFNWVFGDTLSNYVSGVTPGYVVSGASAAVVPVPAAAPLALLGMGIVGFVSRRNRKKA